MIIDLENNTVTLERDEVMEALRRAVTEKMRYKLGVAQMEHCLLITHGDNRVSFKWWFGDEMQHQMNRDGLQQLIDGANVCTTDSVSNALEALKTTTKH